MFLSIVIPFHNEEKNVAPLYEAVLAELKTLDCSYELIFIDDGSKDETWTQIMACRARDANIFALKLSRNFGKEAALTAGIDKAEGDAVILMDGDLQHPPAMIPQLVERLGEGFDMVYAVRDRRNHGPGLRSALSGLYYWLWDRLADTKIPPNAGDFRILNRKAIEALRALPERNRFMKGLYSWIGFEQSEIQYAEKHRLSGQSSWSIRNLFSYGRSAFISFSSLPLRLWTGLGAFISVISIVYALYVVVETVIYGRVVPGYATTVTAIFFLGGVQLFSIGILGEYMASLFDEVKKRPVYLISESHKNDRSQ